MGWIRKCMCMEESVIPLWWKAAPAVSVFNKGWNISHYSIERAFYKHNKLFCFEARAVPTSVVAVHIGIVFHFSLCRSSVKKPLFYLVVRFNHCIGCDSEMCAKAWNNYEKRIIWAYDEIWNIAAEETTFN